MDVVCLVRSLLRARTLLGEKVRCVEADIDTPSPRPLAEGVSVSVVYHLAGLVKAFSWGELLQTNAVGVENVLKMCRSAPTPPVCVLVSSLAAAGPALSGRPRTEDETSNPVSLYGKSKRAGEVAALSFAADLPISIVRPPIVFGAGDPATFSLYESVANWGLHLSPTRRKPQFSFIHVDDLVDALILVGERGERLAPVPAAAEGASPSAETGRGRYYVAHEERPTWPELGGLLGTAVGRKRVWTPASGPILTYAVAGVSDWVGRLRGVPSILSIDKAREATAGSWICDATKIKTQLGFTPAKPLAERLRETAEGYEKLGWLKLRR